MFAAKKGNLDVVRTLIENGHADANIAENASFRFKKKVVQKVLNMNDLCIGLFLDSSFLCQ